MLRFQLLFPYQFKNASELDTGFANITTNRLLESAKKYPAFWFQSNRV